MSETLANEASPCPFCGWIFANVTAEGESSPRSYFVQCAKCWACGPAAGREVYDSAKDAVERQKAIEAWNRRAAVNLPNCRFLYCENKVLHEGDACKDCFESMPT